MGLIKSPQGHISRENLKNISNAIPNLNDLQVACTNAMTKYYNESNFMLFKG